MLTLAGAGKMKTKGAYIPKMLNEKVTSGSNPQSMISIASGDIANQHAVCYFENGGWYLEDLGHHTGTFYRLKNDTQLQQKTPSDEIKLEKNSVFVVEGFNFIVLENN